MVCLTFRKDDTKVIQDALKALGKENLALIIHGSSFPSVDGEDTGFGTFNSTTGHALINYASNIFNALQLGPAGKTKSSDSSPYCGTEKAGLANSEDKALTIYEPADTSRHSGQSPNLPS